MPRLRRVPTLSEVCRGQMAQGVIQVCNAEAVEPETFSAAKRQHRKYLDQLPVSISDQLFEDVLLRLNSFVARSNRQYTYPISLYAVEVLLRNRTQTLRVPFFDMFDRNHQRKLLEELAERGKGLKRLRFTGDYMFVFVPTRLAPPSGIFAAALPYTLLQLEIKVVANNDLLRAVAESCPQLAVLNVFGSRDVTDEGLFNLIQSDKDLRIAHNPWVERDGQLRLELDQKGPLCGTIRVLNLARTSVTAKGFVVALEFFSNVEHLGDDFKVEMALMLEEERWRSVRTSSTSNPTFNLTSLSSWLTHDRLQLFSATCPRLEKLVAVVQDAPATELEKLQHTRFLEAICWSSLQPNWIPNIYTYLKARGEQLVDLRLKHFNEPSGSPPLSLDSILTTCCNLKLLMININQITWTMTRTASRKILPLNNLERVELGDAVTGEAITNLISLAPKLRILHVGSIVSHASNMLQDLGHRLSPNLRCFFVRYGDAFDDQLQVREFLNACPQVKRIGHLKWLVDEQGKTKWINSFGPNVDLEVAEVYHWKAPQCIRKTFL